MFLSTLSFLSLHQTAIQKHCSINDSYALLDWIVFIIVLNRKKSPFFHGTLIEVVSLVVWSHYIGKLSRWF